MDNNEEKFEDLIDQYWDDKLVESKINEDEKDDIEEEYQPRSEAFADSRFDSPFTKKDEIYIDEFVNDYLGIIGDYSNFRHIDLKLLNCPYIIGVANSYADSNPKFVQEKEYLLIVIDKSGNRGTYINPKIAREWYDYDYETSKGVLKQRHVGFEHIEEFVENFERVSAEYQAYLEFFNIIRENKKITKFKKINDYENIFRRDEENDEHKRK